MPGIRRFRTADKRVQKALGQVGLVSCVEGCHIAAPCGTAEVWTTTKSSSWRSTANEADLGRFLTIENYRGAKLVETWSNGKPISGGL